MQRSDVQTPLFFEIHVFVIFRDENDRLRILDVIDHVHDKVNDSYPDTGESGSAYDVEMEAKLV